MMQARYKSIVERPASVFRILLLCNVALVAMYFLAILVNSWILKEWFDLDSELSVPTWFSASQLLVSGILMCLLSEYMGRPGWPTAFFCLTVGVGFIFLSADEASQIHERTTYLAGRYAPWVPMVQGHRGAWIFLYGVTGMALLVLHWHNLLVMWRYHRHASMVIAGGFATIVAGGVLVEVAGYYALLPFESVQIALEEFLEMLGGSIILVGVMIFFGSAVRLTPRAYDVDGFSQGEGAAIRGAELHQKDLAEVAGGDARMMAPHGPYQDRGVDRGHAG
jgi:hypothetical protein